MMIVILQFCEKRKKEKEKSIHKYTHKQRIDIKDMLKILISVNRISLDVTNICFNFRVNHNQELT